MSLYLSFPTRLNDMVLNNEAEGKIYVFYLLSINIISILHDMKFKLKFS
jgi:hypothetical protein